MIQELFSGLYTALTQSLWLALLGAFAWGILSILLSPCHLSSIPLVIGFMLRQEKKAAGSAFVLALVFALGILVSISLIGLVTAALGRLLGDVGRFGNVLVAVVFFVMGLYLLNVLRLDWSFAPKTANRHGLLAAALLGLVFGIGLGPCTFAFVAPVLGVAFAKAQTDLAGAVSLIAAFALGHCSVIVFFGALAQRVQVYLNWTNKNNALLWIRRACGVLVIAAGIYFLVK